jgi:hypothetical protein
MQLPSALLNKGRILYMQIITYGFGSSAITVSSVAGNINGTTTYTFPTTLYAKRMFVSDGSNWYVEPATIA